MVVPKIYWATPCYGIGVATEVYHNHLACVMIASSKYGIKWGGAAITRNQLVWAARNHIVESIFKDETINDDDYIFWVDSDIKLAPDTLPKLLSHNGKDVVTGVYYQKAQPYWPLIMMKLPFERREGMHQFLYDYPKGLYRVDAIGFGCVLAKVSVFKKINKPWFDWKVESGEDIYFCIEAKKVGIEIWADTNAVVGHIGEPEVFTEEHFVKNRNENFEKISDDTFIVRKQNHDG